MMRQPVPGQPRGGAAGGGRELYRKARCEARPGRGGCDGWGGGNGGAVTTGSRGPWVRRRRRGASVAIGRAPAMRNEARLVPHRGESDREDWRTEMSTISRDALRAWFLGPRAENAELFERLVTEALRDHVFWRRNYHPEDGFTIREHDKRSEGYEE